MRVFLDTNVLVAAFAARGLCADVLREVILRHELVVSEVLLEELARALRDKVRLDAEAAREIVAFLRDGASPAPEGPLLPLPLRGPGDRAILSAAVRAGAEYLVTGDREVQALGRAQRTVIVSPRQFWERLRGGNR